MNPIYPIINTSTGAIVKKLGAPNASAVHSGEVLVAGRSDLTQLATGVMLKAYNELAGKSVKKFASREAGERQFMAFLGQQGAKKGAAPAKSSGPKKKAAQKPPKSAKSTAKSSGARATKGGKAVKGSSAGKKTTNKTTPVASGDLSTGRKKRAAPKTGYPRPQHHVEVGGKEFKSVRTAFLAFKLPLNKHILFRKELFKVGKLTFEHKGKKYPFVML